MSKDLAVMKLMDVINPSGLEYHDGLPPSLHIQAPGFSNIEGVYINGYKSPEFFQQSKTMLVAQLPDEVLGDTLRSLTVLSYSFTSATEQSMLKWVLGKRTKSYSGLLKLVQNFTMKLLQTPGSDIFDLSAGGGLLAMVGKPGTGSKSSVTNDVVSAINYTQSYLKKRQSTMNIPNDEKLLHARLLSVGFAEEITAVKASVELTSMAGDSAASNITNLTGFGSF